MKDYSDMIHMDRPVSTHPKMDIGNRAKQFIPMDALRGFSVAVLTKQREKQLVARINLSEDETELLNWQLHQIQSGDTVTVTYFQLEKIIGDLEIGTYVTETAQVEEVDIDGGALVLARAYVPFSDLYIIESEIFDRVYEDESYGEREQT